MGYLTVPLIKLDVTSKYYNPSTDAVFEKRPPIIKPAVIV